MIREAKPSDLAAVLEIAASGFERIDRATADWLVKELNLPGVILYVDSLGPSGVRGFVLIERYTEGDSVKIIAVHPGHRAQGIGRKLLAKAGKSAGAWVRAENKASRAMFTRDGWKIASKTTKKPGEWVYFVRGNLQ